ncbi:MAG: glycerophosphodiester phosphodiesterase [Bacteroidota bacterium]
MKNLFAVSGVILIFTLACMTRNQNNSRVEFPAFSTEAHRGGRGLMPENTIPAMIHALDLGVTTLEMDTHISADGKVILAHDNFINPLFTLGPDGNEIAQKDNQKYALFAMTYSEIKKFDVGSKGNTNFPQQKKIKTHMPLLSDVIDTVQNYIRASGKRQVFYNIETKSKPAGDNKLHPEPEKFVDLLVGVLENKGILPFVVIQSFDVRTLQLVNRKYPNIKTSYLIDNNKTLEENMAILGYKPFILSPASKLVTQDLVDKSHQQNLKVIPWTVNSAEEIARLKRLGVDGIITDYPNLFNQKDAKYF